MNIHEMIRHIIRMNETSTNEILWIYPPSLTSSMYDMDVCFMFIDSFLSSMVCSTRQEFEESEHECVEKIWIWVGGTDFRYLNI